MNRTSEEFLCDLTYKEANPCSSFSASPLNGEAAELWDSLPQEFQRKVLARHRDLEDEE